MNKNPIETVIEFWTEFARKQIEFQNESFKEVVKFNQNLMKQLPEVFNINAFAKKKTSSVE